MEHTFDMNDINRAWTGLNGWIHAVCSCGIHLSAPTDEEMTSKMVEHIRERG